MNDGAIWPQKGMPGLNWAAILEQLRDKKMVKNIYPKIGEWLFRWRMLNPQNPLAITSSPWYSYQ